MSTFEKLIALHKEDLARSIFPLDTNHYLLESGADELNDYVYNKIGPSETADASFITQQRVYASKHGLNLRRTQKLDPVSEFFIYDIVYRHRNNFRPDFSVSRRNFGYRFLNGSPIPASASYKDYKDAISEAAFKYKFFLKFDIANYFNSVYHHDLASWFAEYAESDNDREIFGKFFRQINAGRSVDCLTQGILPTKILGSHFLKFVDNSPKIKSPILLRFMDDFYLFSNDQRTLFDDFIIIQKLLGEKCLSVNPSKTEFGESIPAFVDTSVDSVRLSLLKRKRIIYRSSGGLEEDEDVDVVLSEAEVSYLLSLLDSKTMDEEDAELILALMRESGNDVLKHLSHILARFPYLSRNVALFCDHISDESALADLLVEFLDAQDIIAEYQLFWIARIVEKKLLGNPKAADLVTRLYEHRSATKISRAKILEIPSKRYGLSELRAEHLRSGSSDWLSWSSAVGSRCEVKSSRNHLLGYFANGSQINKLIAAIIQKK